MILERELYIKDRFLSTLSSGANLTELCNFLSACIGVPAAITLTSKTIIAKSKDYTDDLVEEYVKSMDLCAMDELEEVHKEIDGILLYSRKPEMRTWPYSRYKRLNCGCFWHGRMLAVIDCPIVGKTLQEDAEVIVGMAAPIFMTALRLNGYIDVNTVDPMQTFILGLMRGEINESNQMYSQGYATEKDWRVLCFASNDGDNTDRIYTVVDAVCMRMKDSWAVEHAGYVYVLLNAEDEKSVRELQRVCKGLCRIGVSDPFRNVLQLQQHGNDARDLLRLSAFACNEDELIFESKYKVLLRFLTSIQSEGEKVCDPVIEEMKRYDAEHESEYFQTMKLFLLLRRDYQAVADRMHIHKNTATYRIQRISEMFGVDFKDNRAITSLYLSLFADL